MNGRGEVKSSTDKNFNRGRISSVSRALDCRVWEVAGSIPGAGPILRVLKITEK